MRLSLRLSSCVLLTGSALTIAGCGGGMAPHNEDVPVPTVDVEPGGHPSPRATPGDSPSAMNVGDVLQTGPFRKTFDGITFSVPKGWQEVKLAGNLVGFVDARFVIPADGATVELTCLSSGGGADENVRRWVDQFLTAPDGKTLETIDVDGVPARWVDLRGTYNGNASGKPGPHADWRMLGAAIPIGGRSFSLKLNGPESAVAAVYDDFRDFVKSARIEK